MTWTWAAAGEWHRFWIDFKVEPLGFIWVGVGAGA
jgi:hypothetical protein